MYLGKGNMQLSLSHLAMLNLLGSATSSHETSVLHQEDLCKRLEWWSTMLVCWAVQFLEALLFLFHFVICVCITVILHFTAFFVLFRKSLYNAVFYGIMNGFSDGIFYFLYAVLFRYGAYAVTVDSDHVAFVNYKELLMLVPSMYFVYTLYMLHVFCIG